VRVTEEWFFLKLFSSTPRWGRGEGFGGGVSPVPPLFPGYGGLYPRKF